MALDTHVTPLPPKGLFYDDMHVGLRFPSPPGVLVDAGIASLYTAISGDGLAVTLDHELCRQVTGNDSLLVNPALVLHVSIGASTVATRNVIGNLFYRNVVLANQVHQGTTLRTITGVLAMADSRPKPGSAPRGKVVLGIQTTTSDGEVVVPVSDPLLTTAPVGVSVSVYAEGLVLAADAHVVEVVGGVIFVAVDKSDGPIVAAAAQLRTASIVFTR